MAVPSIVSPSRRALRAFTLIEVIISLVILGIGVIFLLRLFPTGVQRSAESERLTRATLLAQEIMEAIKSQGGTGLISIIPGSPEFVPMAGDGVDGDEDGLDMTGSPLPGFDHNSNGTLDADYDGYPEPDYADCDRDSDFRGCIAGGDGVDNDLDGIIDDDGDSNFCEISVISGGVGGLVWAIPSTPDGDLNYDPELFERGYDGRRRIYAGVDEEWPDGVDDDGDGIDVDGDGTDDLTIDEDVRLASNLRDWLWYPLEPGDNVDNDGDGEPGSPVDGLGRAVADGLDNNGDGRIDEGIDEEVFNGINDDGDGRTDEDCRAASYPFTPRKFFRRFLIDDDGDGLVDEDPIDNRDNDLDGRIDEDPPNDDTDQFSWQIIVGRVPDGGGDGINNDGDYGSGGSTASPDVIDEEIRNGLNDDPPCRVGAGRGDLLVDEDCEAAPVRGFRRITVRITWNGDGDANRDGWPGGPGNDDDDGVADFLDPEIRAAMQLEALFLGIEGDPTEDPMLRQRWAQDDDEDGRIDEEKRNGIDDDLDGRIDEDCYGNEYNLTGFLEL